MIYGIYNVEKMFKKFRCNIFINIIFEGKF